MLSNTRIGNIYYYSTDIDRTEAFYRDVVGLNVQRMDDDGDGNPWLIAPIEGNIELLFFKGECRPGNSPVVVFDLPEGGIDDVVSGLAGKGATIVTPVSHAPGGWSSEFADPDGHTISMYQSESVPRSRTGPPGASRSGAESRHPGNPTAQARASSKRARAWLMRLMFRRAHKASAVTGTRSSWPSSVSS